MSTFDDILNFIMPILVFLFIGFIFYRIPLVKKGVDALSDKIRDWRENRDAGLNEPTLYNTIEYE